MTPEQAKAFLASCKEAETLLSDADLKRIARDYGYDCHLRWSAFYIKDRQYHGLVAYLVSPCREVVRELGLWGSLRQMREDDVRTYIQGKVA